MDSYECEVTFRLVIEADDEDHAERVRSALVGEMLAALPEPLRSRWSWVGPRDGVDAPLPRAAEDLAQKYADAHVAILWAQAPRGDGDEWEVGAEGVEVADEAGLASLCEMNLGALLEAQATPGGFFSYTD